jgi:hypothetical protein
VGKLSVDYENHPKYKAANAKRKLSYERLHITSEIELAVISYLADVGVLTQCEGVGACDGPCPSGQGCIKVTSGACVCSNQSFWD